MRNLTIKRRKSFAGCLAKMKIYIEDAYSTDIKINNIYCRKLGDLKNNEEKTFNITEDKAKVFVIADKLSKNYCNDFYQLADGKEDIFLSGKNKLNLINGNAFRFDNNENYEALQNRKTSTKKSALIFCVSIIVSIIIGYTVSFNLFSNLNEKPRVFSENGMSITLTNEFSESQAKDYTNYYDSANVAVFAVKEEFNLAEGFEDYTLDQYGELVLKNNGISSAKIKDIDGLKGFEYEFTNTDTNKEYKYKAFIYKSSDAFWLVQFATPQEKSDEYSSKITEWAKSVNFE